MASAERDRAGPPPPSGFGPPPTDGRAGGRSGDEIARLLQVARELRQQIPPELDARLADALHELLVALRALLDWMIERQARADERPSEVQDIPIL
jgi:hypothetical protein